MSKDEITSLPLGYCYHKTAMAEKARRAVSPYLFADEEGHILQEFSTQKMAKFAKKTRTNAYVNTPIGQADVRNVYAHENHLFAFIIPEIGGKHHCFCGGMVSKRKEPP